MTIKTYFILFFFILFIYNCSPINKQHGYLLDDVIVSSEKIANFAVDQTTKKDIYAAMGSPSIEIKDIDDIWIYLISLKEKHVFEEDELTYQTVFRFSFNDEGVLKDKVIVDHKDHRKIVFSSEKTKVRRDAYGITDQLYEAFTRGQ